MKTREKVVVLLFYVAALTLALLRLWNVQVPSVMMLLGGALKAVGIGY